MNGERILVAMSGGVDSSVAAARLVAQGADVVGVTLHLWDYPDDGSVQGRCCAPEDVHDARRVADFLGIPHYSFDRRDRFLAEVVDPFVEAYLEGETPSPCVRCNRGVKLRELSALAQSLGASRVATGHYARIGQGPRGLELMRARDESKDQSYFLHMVEDATLAQLCFPLGDATKEEVRKEALALGLPGAAKGESQELCFVPTGRYDAFVDERARGRVRPGAILNDAGQVVGHHDGIHRFTLGQRKNLGVALGYRAYVTEVNPEGATVTLGRRDAARMNVLQLAQLTLRHPPDAAELACQIVPRYRARATPARLTLHANSSATARLEAAVDLVAPGQYAVLYDGERVLGGGVIAASRLEEAPRAQELAVQP